MRSPRVVVTMLGLALVASLTLTPSSASARVSGSAPAAAGADRVALAPAAGTSARAAADITVTATVVKRRVKKNGPKRLVIQGKVTPAKGPVYIQRATKCNKAKGTCNFKFYKKRFVKKGRYYAVIDAPPRLRGWVFRAKVKNSYSDAWVTCTKRPTQTCKVPY